MFFLRSKPLKPINLSFDETMTPENCYNVCKKLSVFNRNTLIENTVELSNTYNDLEMFQSQDSQNVCVTRDSVFLILN